MKAVLVAFALLGFAALVSSQTIATVVIKGTTADAGITGYARFSQINSTSMVSVHIVVSGITTNPNSMHGIHVHEFGDIRGNNGTFSGSHYNPLAAGHGCPENNGTSRHLGDMGNWNVTNGSIDQTKTLDLLSLFGSNSIIGHTLTIHGSVDDCAVTGSAGPRIAQGIVGIANSTVYNGGAAATAATNPNVYTTAVATLTSASLTGVTGTVYMSQPTAASNVTIYGEFYGLTAGRVYGFHLHVWGDISDANATAVGAHYNPTNVVHGVPPYNTRHYGDLGNIWYTTGGVHYYQYTIDKIALGGSGLGNVIGRAFIIHANLDDCSNPIGNSGGRIAQGVIGVPGAAYYNGQAPPLFPATVPTYQNGTQLCNAISSIGGSSAGTQSGSESDDGSSAASALVAGLVALFAFLF